jgi:hypothetical protein
VGDVGYPESSCGEEECDGRVWVIYGGRHLPPRLSVPRLGKDGFELQPDRRFLAQSLGGATAAGDLDGDGHDDALLYATIENGENAFVLWGGGQRRHRDLILGRDASYLVWKFGSELEIVPLGDVNHDDEFDDQRQRGRRYQTQIEQFIGFRDVVGAVWHAWSDRFILTNPALQINLGLVQCSDPRRHMEAGRRWDRIDSLIAETNRTINQRITARTGY